MNRKLVAALSLYFALGATTGFFVGGNMRLGLWIFLAGLAVKTLIAHYRPKDG